MASRDNQGSPVKFVDKRFVSRTQQQRRPSNRYLGVDVTPGFWEKQSTNALADIFGCDADHLSHAGIVTTGATASEAPLEEGHAQQVQPLPATARIEPEKEEHEEADSNSGENSIVYDAVAAAEVAALHEDAKVAKSAHVETAGVDDLPRLTLFDKRKKGRNSTADSSPPEKEPSPPLTNADSQLPCIDQSLNAPNASAHGSSNANAPPAAAGMAEMMRVFQHMMVMQMQAQSTSQPQQHQQPQVPMQPAIATQFPFPGPGMPSPAMVPSPAMMGMPVPSPGMPIHPSMMPGASNSQAFPFQIPANFQMPVPAPGGPDPMLAAMDMMLKQQQSLPLPLDDVQRDKHKMKLKLLQEMLAKRKAQVDAISNKQSNRRLASRSRSRSPRRSRRTHGGDKFSRRRQSSSSSSSSDSETSSGSGSSRSSSRSYTESESSDLEEKYLQKLSSLGVDIGEGSNQPAKSVRKRRRSRSPRMSRKQSKSRSPLLRTRPHRSHSHDRSDRRSHSYDRSDRQRGRRDSRESYGRRFEDNYRGRGRPYRGRGRGGFGHNHGQNFDRRRGYEGRDGYREYHEDRGNYGEYHESRDNYREQQEYKKPFMHRTDRNEDTHVDDLRPFDVDHIIDIGTVPVHVGESEKPDEIDDATVQWVVEDEVTDEGVGGKSTEGPEEVDQRQTETFSHSIGEMADEPPITAEVPKVRKSKSSSSRKKSRRDDSSKSKKDRKHPKEKEQIVGVAEVFKDRPEPLAEPFENRVQKEKATKSTETARKVGEQNMCKDDSVHPAGSVDLKTADRKQKHGISVNISKGKKRRSRSRETTSDTQKASEPELQTAMETVASVVPPAPQPSSDDRKRKGKRDKEKPVIDESRQEADISDKTSSDDRKQKEKRDKGKPVIDKCRQAEDVSDKEARPKRSNRRRRSPQHSISKAIRSPDRPKEKETPKSTSSDGKRPEEKRSVKNEPVAKPPPSQPVDEGPPQKSERSPSPVLNEELDLLGISMEGLGPDLTFDEEQDETFAEELAKQEDTWSGAEHVEAQPNVEAGVAPEAEVKTSRRSDNRSDVRKERSKSPRRDRDSKRRRSKRERSRSPLRRNRDESPIHRDETRRAGPRRRSPVRKSKQQAPPVSSTDEEALVVGGSAPPEKKSRREPRRKLESDGMTIVVRRDVADSDQPWHEHDRFEHDDRDFKDYDAAEEAAREADNEEEEQEVTVKVTLDEKPVREKEQPRVQSKREGSRNRNEAHFSRPRQFKGRDRVYRNRDLPETQFSISIDRDEDFRRNDFGFRRERNDDFRQMERGPALDRLGPGNNRQHGRQQLGRQLLPPSHLQDQPQVVGGNRNVRNRLGGVAPRRKFCPSW